MELNNGVKTVYKNEVGGNGKLVKILWPNTITNPIIPICLTDSFNDKLKNIKTKTYCCNDFKKQGVKPNIKE